MTPPPARVLERPRVLGRAAGWPGWPAWPTLALLVAIVVLDAGLLALRDDAPLLAMSVSSTGLAAALLARAPARRWPALLLAVCVVTLAIAALFGIDLRTGLTVAGSHGVQALVAATILTDRARRRVGLTSLSDLARLAGAATAVGLVAAVVEVLPRPDATASGVTTLEVGLQHAVSLALLCTLVLGRGESRRVSPGVWAASALLYVVLLAVFVPVSAPALSFAPFPFLIWSAVALDVRLVAAQLVAVSGVVAVTTAHGRGPFVDGGIAADLLGTTVLLYVAGAILVSLPLVVITAQRRRLVEQLTAEEQRFRRSFTDSPLGMVMMRAEGADLLITDVNAAAARILEVPAEELVERRFADLVGVVDDHDRVLQELPTERVESWHGPATVRARSGSRLDLAVAAVERSPSARSFSAQLLDRTEEHESRRRLELAHQLTDATLDTAACLILVADEHGHVVRVNGATRRLTGYDEAALVGASLWDLPLQVLTRSETEAMFLWPNRSGRPMTRERLSYTADGRPIRLVWSTSVVRSEDGSPPYAVLTGVDVTAERSTTGLMTHLLNASVATALIGIDVGGRITVFNTGAERLLGSTAEELVGQPFVSILDPAQLLSRTGATGEHEAFLCLVGMIGDDETAARDWIWRTAAGHELIVSMTLSVTANDVEDRVGFLCVARDVTEQREGRDTLVAALDKERTVVQRLRALDRAKDEFVSTVSHELRTPVTSILGYAELLLDGDIVEPDAQQVGMLETIARNSHRLITICDDLLLLSGFDARESLAPAESCDLCETVGVAEDVARALVGQRPLTLRFVRPEDPVLVSGDTTQLERALVNLVSNAVKFTPDDGTVEVRLRRDQVDGAVITVSDTGIGIHPDDHDRVFRRFYRTEHAQLMAIPGTGLGLSIVEGIVEAHGGSIALESEPGAGTTFTVRLPVVA